MGKKLINSPRRWSHYNSSLIKRGSLTLWFDEQSIGAWHQAGKTGKAGRPYQYSELAICCGLTIKNIYHLPLRAAQGFIQSLIQLLKLPIQAPNYSTLCRRQKGLKVRLQALPKKDVNLVVDSTGLKVYGEGEWKVKQHGYSKRRTWRKVHIAVDPASLEIHACLLSSNDVSDGEALAPLLSQIEGHISLVAADGAYDQGKCYRILKERGTKAIIPPRPNAKIQQHGNHKKPPLVRDENLRAIRKVGRKRWKIEVGYHKRSLAETSMYRFKQLFTDKLCARLFENQATEAFSKCQILNRMIQVGL